MVRASSANAKVTEVPSAHVGIGAGGTQFAPSAMSEPFKHSIVPCPDQPVPTTARQLQVSDAPLAKTEEISGATILPPTVILV
jgi:hypothetical protein